jgi:hypothetical protein
MHNLGLLGAKKEILGKKVPAISRMLKTLSQTNSEILEKLPDCTSNLQGIYSLVSS